MIEGIALTVLKKAWPYAMAAAVGASAAWWVQGLRVDAAKNEFAAYKVDQRRLKNEAEEEARKRRETSDKEWREKYDVLKKDGDAYRRCVAAGRCGGLRLPGTCGPDNRLSPSRISDEASPNSIPPTGEPAAQVVDECAVTTLMLNELQRDIEKQKGY